ncbi:hypothetical protein ALMP_57740 [Streptomyces sp. A012304]|nr:hypothetical protein ALMP_57740 [Streptomyces sp. A012304]
MNQSTWDPVPVRRRIAERMVPLIGPDAWAVDDVSFPKDGKMSVAVAPQYCGALGKQANCQVAVSVHAVSDTASCPLQWRLFVPQEWADDPARRRKTGVPGEIGHREKWRLLPELRLHQRCVASRSLGPRQPRCGVALRWEGPGQLSVTTPHRTAA